MLYLSGRPTGVCSEDKISVLVVAVCGATGGVSEGEPSGVQTGNRLHGYSQSRDGPIRETP